MKRKIVIVVSTLAILALAFYLSGLMADSKKPAPKKKVNNIAKVYTTEVKNQNSAVNVIATGRLLAKDRVELFAEVQGIMENTGAEFKAGVPYKQGETLLNINSEVFEAGLIAQRSNLQNLVISALSDIKLDFPESFKNWDDFAKKLDPNQKLPSLPKPINQQEKLFISGRNIYSTYYNVKNAELTLDKYTISAPYTGTLTEAYVTKGSLVRPGQKLGVFIKTGTYELETAIRGSLVKHLKVGQNVLLNGVDENSENYTGKLVRVNDAVDAGTQTVKVFIEVSGKNLAEGQYLNALVSAQEIPNSFEIPRAVLLSTNEVFVVNSKKLQKKAVVPKHFSESSVIVSGLKDGDKLVIQSLPNAYEGMMVEEIKS